MIVDEAVSDYKGFGTSSAVTPDASVSAISLCRMSRAFLDKERAVRPANNRDTIGAASSYM